MAGKKEESLYETPWSFTIAEIVQRLCDEGVQDCINIQIGRSDDYPPPIDITRNRTMDGIPHDESTKAVDQALQEFNKDGNIYTLSVELERIQTMYPEIFQAWQTTLGA